MLHATSDASVLRNYYYFQNVDDDACSQTLSSKSSRFQELAPAEDGFVQNLVAARAIQLDGVFLHWLKRQLR
eukprot:CAMPEP_0115313438 /NCGR_PEP_ID=MMETSP0270-20121206/76474_1 /TAXON_ID=71861 /ORGANISM="Scrippsiella trochoidea, Strain CCMP3099" /LENGTH=71 /DNA_ID=CAMNT_0002732547 /DNA_START=599 /DNA_END=810 /DNA_ORIENTATION=-